MASPASPCATAPLDQLRTELADLAFALERQGRRDAADVVMRIDDRVRELTDADRAARVGRGREAQVPVAAGGPGRFDPP